MNWRRIHPDEHARIYASFPAPTHPRPLKHWHECRARVRELDRIGDRRDGALWRQLLRMIRGRG
jgi:hypothetical protein